MAKRQTTNSASTRHTACDDEIVAAVIGNPALVRVDGSGGEMKPVLNCNGAALRSLIAEIREALQD